MHVITRSVDQVTVTRVKGTRQKLFVLVGRLNSPSVIEDQPCAQDPPTLPFLTCHLYISMEIKWLSPAAIRSCPDKWLILYWAKLTVC